MLLLGKNKPDCCVHIILFRGWCFLNGLIHSIQVGDEDHIAIIQGKLILET